jgi:hypothetical protein
MMRTGEVLSGSTVLYMMVAVLPFSLLWLAVLTLWKRIGGDGRAPRSFSIWSGWVCLSSGLVLHYLMSPQTSLPSPDSDWLAEYWLLSLFLVAYGMSAVSVGLMFACTTGTRPTRVRQCDRCGSREHLHTEYCIRCGHRFLPRRAASDIPPAI